MELKELRFGVAHAPGGLPWSYDMIHLSPATPCIVMLRYVYERCRCATLWSCDNLK